MSTQFLVQLHAFLSLVDAWGTSKAWETTYRKHREKSGGYRSFTALTQKISATLDSLHQQFCFTASPLVSFALQTMADVSMWKEHERRIAQAQHRHYHMQDKDKMPGSPWMLWLLLEHPKGPKYIDFILICCEGLKQCAAAQRLLVKAFSQCALNFPISVSWRLFRQNDRMQMQTRVYEQTCMFGSDIIMPTPNGLIAHTCTEMCLYLYYLLYRYIDVDMI